MRCNAGGLLGVLKFCWKLHDQAVMNWCVDQQVLPLGIRQSGKDSVIDLVHHVINGCQYGAFRLVVWVHALLDKFRVDFIQQFVVQRHDGATTVLNPLGMRNSPLESMGSLHSPTLRRVSENPLAFSSFPIKVTLIFLCSWRLCH